jgi:hypothetical protein
MGLQCPGYPSAQHYELGVEVAPVFRLATAFGERQVAI